MRCADSMRSGSSGCRSPDTKCAPRRQRWHPHPAALHGSHDGRAYLPPGLFPANLAALLLATTVSPATFATDFVDNRVFREKAGSGDIAAVTALLKAGADASEADYQGSSASLMAAAVAGHVNMVRVLLAAGARVNARDTGGWTALLYATQGHHRWFRC